MKIASSSPGFRYQRPRPETDGNKSIEATKNFLKKTRKDLEDLINRNPDVVAGFSEGKIEEAITTLKKEISKIELILKETT